MFFTCTVSAALAMSTLSAGVSVSERQDACTRNYARMNSRDHLGNSQQFGDHYIYI